MSLATDAPSLTPRKAVTDAWIIARLSWLRVKPTFFLWMSTLFLFPVSTLFFARYLLPEGSEATPRLIAGSMVYSLGLLTVNVLANNLSSTRFLFQLKLIQVCPVHPYSYIAGSLVEPVARASVIACLLLLFAPVYRIDIQLSPWLAPVVALTALSLAGVAFIIGTWAPSMEIANVLSLVAGILLVILSPIYFPVSRLPDWMEPLARLSPYTYAADAIDAILSGRGGFLDEVAVLTAITVVTMGIGLAGIRWREA